VTLVFIGLLACLDEGRGVGMDRYFLFSSGGRWPDRFSDSLILDSVQDAVDEASGILGSESFSEVDCLVNGNLGRNLLTVEQFKKSHAEDTPVDHVDAIQPPILRILLDEPVQLRKVL